MDAQSSGRPALSLRRRLILSFLAILAGSLAVGALLAGWQAREKLKDEMTAAIEVGRATANRALQLIPVTQRSRSRAEDVVRLFDGDRHLRAGLTDGEGKLLFVSYFPSSRSHVPVFLADLLTPTAQTAHFEIANVGSLALVTDATLEVDAAAKAIMANMVTLLIFFGMLLTLALIFLRQLLQPLSQLSTGLARIGQGDYGVRLDESGPAELAKLSGGFNAMAAQLDDMHRRNHDLGEQLAMVQEEERADLARDLHDDIGPLLFAIDVDATTIKALASEDTGGKAVNERAQSIQTAVSEAKKLVRAILGKLRPGVVTQLGLRQNVEDMLDFLRDRHPDVNFAADIAEESFGARIDSACHAVMREAINNALKHGKPTRIDIEVHRDHVGDLRLKVADDGGGFAATTGQGYGIVGMRERILALGGEFHADPRFDVNGVAISARLPGRGRNNNDLPVGG